MSFSSASIIAKKLNIERNVFAQYLLKKEYIIIENGKWKLTKTGERIGAKYSIAKDGKQFILWPEQLEIEIAPTNNDQVIKEINDGTYILSKKIGDKYGILQSKVDLLLSEIGWIEKTQDIGWKTTQFGKILGAKEKEDNRTGYRFIIWPKEILENKILESIITSFKRQFIEEEKEQNIKRNEIKIEKFRQDLPGKYRTKDGHWVRSRAEIIIDDALYYYEVPHAYERKIPIEEEIYSDFYLPQGKVYIEFWGLENDERYLERKKVKIDIYRKYNLSLIQLDDKPIISIDDYLPQMLLKFGISVE